MIGTGSPRIDRNRIHFGKQTFADLDICRVRELQTHVIAGDMRIYSLLGAVPPNPHLRKNPYKTA